MPYRKVPLVENEIYHIYNKSIADFVIFNNDTEYKRMMEEIAFYAFENPPCSFSLFKKFKEKQNQRVFLQIKRLEKIVRILAYCIMPTHIHFVLEQLRKNGISDFINLISKSYAKYFNKKHNRKGPLWEGRFNNVLVKDNIQFNHLTRYVHLNPVTARLVNNPKDWTYSSYREYAGLTKESDKLCNFSDYLDMDIPEYIKFVNDGIGYQRELALIKHLTLE